VIKGSFVNHFLKKFIGLCRFGLDRVICYLDRLVGVQY
jgi:hypothetical protein